MDYRADLWSLAVIAFECLTGVRPFSAPRPSANSFNCGVLQAHSDCVSAVASVPDGFDAWFARGTGLRSGRSFSGCGGARRCIDASVRALLERSSPLTAVRPRTSRNSPQSRAEQPAPGVISPAQTAARQVLLASSRRSRSATHGAARRSTPPRLLDKQRELFRSVGLAQGGVICDESSSSAILVPSASPKTQFWLAAVQLQRLASGLQWPAGARPSGGRWRSTYAGSQPRAAGISMPPIEHSSRGAESLSHTGARFSSRRRSGNRLCHRWRESF